MKTWLSFRFGFISKQAFILPSILNQFLIVLFIDDDEDDDDDDDDDVNRTHSPLILSLYELI